MKFVYDCYVIASMPIGVRYPTGSTGSIVDGLATNPMTMEFI